MRYCVVSSSNAVFASSVVDTHQPIVFEERED